MKWFPLNLTPPFNIVDTEGRSVSVTNIEIIARFQVRYFFGHLNDLPDISALHNIESEETTFIFDIEDVPKILPALHEYRTADALPKIEGLTLNLVSVRDRTKPLL
jgi:hypothetical protein